MTIVIIYQLKQNEKLTFDKDFCLWAKRVTKSEFQKSLI